jgi:glutathione-regulated potassium-efflux system ancillary protein KefC
MGYVHAAVYPCVSLFCQRRDERWYYTLLMATGLTFGTISSLYGLAHGLVNQEQYSFLVTAVIASAVVPTVIASLMFMPIHLLSRDWVTKGRRPMDGLNEEG